MTSKTAWHAPRKRHLTARPSVSHNTLGELMDLSLLRSLVSKDYWSLGAAAAESCQSIEPRTHKQERNKNTEHLEVEMGPTKRSYFRNWEQPRRQSGLAGLYTLIEKKANDHLQLAHGRCTTCNWTLRTNHLSTKATKCRCIQQS